MRSSEVSVYHKWSNKSRFLNIKKNMKRLSAQQCVNSVELGLVTVAESFDLVKAEKEGNAGLPVITQEMGLALKEENTAIYITVLDINGEEAQGGNGDEE
jgi:hypothetical protein